MPAACGHVFYLPRARHGHVCLVPGMWSRGAFRACFTVVWRFEWQGCPERLPHGMWAQVQPCTDGNRLSPNHEHGTFLRNGQYCFDSRSPTEVHTGDYTHEQVRLEYSRYYFSHIFLCSTSVYFISVLSIEFLAAFNS